MLLKKIGKWWCNYLLRMFFFILDDVDSCTPNPCQNGGTCMIESGMAKCTCPPEKTGDNCAGMWISDCARQKCTNIITKMCRLAMTMNILLTWLVDYDLSTFLKMLYLLL